jgi:hypothetical protein
VSKDRPLESYRQQLADLSLAVSVTPSRTPSAAAAATARSTSRRAVSIDQSGWDLGVLEEMPIPLLEAHVPTPHRHIPLTPSLRPVRLPRRQAPLVRVGPEGQAQEDHRHRPCRPPQVGQPSLQERLP